MNFLNDEENYSELSKSKINSSGFFDEELHKSLSQDIVLLEEISDVAYAYLLKSVPWWYNQTDFSNLSENKFKSLIKQRKMRFTVTNFNYLINSDSDKYLQLIETDIDTFLEEKDKLDLPSGTISKLISSVTLEKKEKEKILKTIDSNELFPELFNSEEGFSLALNQFLIKEKIDTTLSFDFITHILNSEKDRDTRKKLTILFIPNIDNTQIHSLLSMLQEPYSDIKPTGYSISIPKSDINIELVKSLESTKYISSFNIKKEIQVYMKRS